MGFLGIFDFGDGGIGHYEYEFSQLNLGYDLVRRISKYYTFVNLDVKSIMDNSLFAILGFYVNFLNGIEKVQKDCLEKLNVAVDRYLESQ